MHVSIVMNDFYAKTGLRICITSNRIRILLLKVVRIFSQWSKSLLGSILSLHVSIVSIRGPPWLHFGPLQPQNFDFNANPDRIQLLTPDKNKCGPPWLHFGPLQPQNFDFNVDPDRIQLFTLDKKKL